MQKFHALCRTCLFWIGLGLFALLTLLEMGLGAETDAICFFKGLACGLEAAGVVFFLRKRSA